GWRRDSRGLENGAATAKEAADYLAARAEPLNFSGNGAAAPPRPQAAITPRRAATGIVPDMTDQGEGVRVGSVQPGSGAESAGIKAGDRLLALGGVKTANLRALADALSDLA